MKNTVNFQHKTAVKANLYFVWELYLDKNIHYNLCEEVEFSNAYM
jgi:hypothetical protein